MVGSFAACCARAASGYAAAAPLRTVIKLRRFIRLARQRGRARGKLDGQIKMAKSFGLMRPPFDSSCLRRSSALVVAGLDPHVAAVGPAQLRQALQERRHAGLIFRIIRLSTPMCRIRSRCCARAASGHAAAPPSSVMNSRRCNQIM
jgi:hypothetical protein